MDAEVLVLEGNNGIIAMPKNMFNLREVYVFNSSCDSTRCNNPNADGCFCTTQSFGCQNGEIQTGECCCNKDCWTYYEEAHWKRTLINSDSQE